MLERIGRNRSQDFIQHAPKKDSSLCSRIRTVLANVGGFFHRNSSCSSHSKKRKDSVEWIPLQEMFKNVSENISETKCSLERLNKSSGKFHKKAKKAVKVLNSRQFLEFGLGKHYPKPFVSADVESQGGLSFDLDNLASEVSRHPESSDLIKREKEVGKKAPSLKEKIRNLVKTTSSFKMKREAEESPSSCCKCFFKWCDVAETCLTLLKIQIIKMLVMFERFVYSIFKCYHPSKKERKVVHAESLDAQLIRADRLERRLKELEKIISDAVSNSIIEDSKEFEDVICNIEFSVAVVKGLREQTERFYSKVSSTNIEEAKDSIINSFSRELEGIMINLAEEILEMNECLAVLERLNDGLSKSIRGI